MGRKCAAIGPARTRARWRGHLDKLLPAPKKVQKVLHHAALQYRQIGGFMWQLRSTYGVAARALEFVILTAARTGEVIGAQWREFDLDAGLWTVPAERMKACREHSVPLSDRSPGAVVRDFIRERFPEPFLRLGAASYRAFVGGLPEHEVVGGAAYDALVAATAARHRAELGTCDRRAAAVYEGYCSDAVLSVANHIQPFPILRCW
jgi:hypothetical protein